LPAGLQDSHVESPTTKNKRKGRGGQQPQQSSAGLDKPSDNAEVSEDIDQKSQAEDEGDGDHEVLVEHLF
jgi:hypothetical protein